MRKKSVRQKLNAIASEFKGRNVLLVDDSIVRGTTSREIVQMARDAGARKVYLASAAPPVRYPERVRHRHADRGRAGGARPHASRRSARSSAADALIYQDVERMKRAIGTLNPQLDGFDASCFDGVYVTGDINAGGHRRGSTRRASARKTRLTKTTPQPPGAAQRAGA